MQWKRAADYFRRCTVSARKSGELKKLTRGETAERLREADLARHLENGDAPVRKEEKKDDKKKEPGRTLAAADDYQLQEALNLLKGISFFKANGI